MALSTKQVNHLLTSCEHMLLHSIKSMAAMSKVGGNKEYQETVVGVKQYIQQWRDMNNNITNTDDRIPK